MNAMLIVCSVSVLLSITSDADAPGPNREAVVAALRHHEDLVKTLYIDYEYTMFPTSHEQLGELRQALGSKKGS